MLRQYEAEDLAPLAQRLRQENRRANWIALGVLVAVSGLLIVVGFQNGVAFPFRLLQLVGLAIPLANASRGYKQRREAFLKAVQIVSQAMDRSTLGPLLQIRDTTRGSTLPEATRLASTCDTILRRRLPRATEDELLRLTPEERKILVRLLARALGSPLTKPAFRPNQEPSLSEAEPATAILLVLASLKQPGGERTARRILKRFKNEALREAAQDYLKAMT
ncbi:hypothetical protein [Armatimonas sp.]|uniref:hypothetical protein n=1 Tax=Armatimonas sp. TaxID=1872638 RepID=UPI00286B150B|nr:hypothetical protein [Armatimonas sp.]